jgi:glycerol-3-phosphate dehydrogenase subunit C
VRSLETEVLVIGGGATGAGVLWDCALRGFDTVLVERSDLAEGTSGRFHGLLHSGGRYVVKDPRAADECVRENVVLRRIAADCIEDTGGLFVTTPDDEPDLGERTVAVLAHNGVGVEVPQQGCCGLPLQSNGLFDDARRYVRRLARRLAPSARAGTPVVSTNPSCALMLKREAREILGLEQDAELSVVGEATYDICEYLLDLDREGQLRTDFAPLPLTVAYHAPCQQQGHGIGKPALDLLALIPELRTIELDATCCGMAGTYGIKREKYEIALQVGNGLFGQVARAAPALVVCDTDTCRWQIAQATGVETVHPVDVLHRAYGLG